MTDDTSELLVDEARVGEAPPKAADARRKRPRLVEIVFTPEQIAYLDSRMRIVTQTRPTRRAGGSSLKERRLGGLSAT